MLLLASRLVQRVVCLLLVALLTLVSAPAPLRAQNTVTLTVTPLFAGNYVFGAWLPFQVALENSGPSVDAWLTATIPGSASRTRLAVELPPGAQKQVTLYVAMLAETASVAFTLAADSGALAQTEVPVRLRRGERLFAITAEQTPALALPRRQDLTTLPLLALDLPPAQLPDRTAGLSNLQLLLLNDIATANLTPAQGQALTGWVARGGHLIIGGGSGAQRTIDGLPPELLPATLGTAQTLDPAALGRFADADPPAQLPGVTLQPRTGAFAVGAAAAPLWVYTGFGSGQVTQLAFDPGLDELRRWAGAPAFWDRLLRPAPFLDTAGPLQDMRQEQEQVLTTALGYLPPFRLPPTNILFLILVVYTILIGPGIALVLRRFDRQALGWVVLPLAALVAAGAGFGLALQLRTEQLVVTQVSLVEQVDAGHAYVQTMSGVLTPQTESFALQTPPEALARPLRPASGPYGPISGAAGVFGQDAAVHEVTIERWSLQGVLAEQQTAFPALEADVVVTNNQITAQVRNTTDQTLRDVFVVYGEQAVALGEIAPAALATADWPQVPAAAENRLPTGTPLSVLALGPELEAARQPGNTPERALLVREGLINAAFVRLADWYAAGPTVIAWLDVSPLDVAVAAPNAAIRQTTLLVVPAAISGSGAVTLPPGWLRLNPAVDAQPVCLGRLGSGISPASTVTATLQLPRDLAALRAETLTLSLLSERTWPNAGVATAIYNWQTESWVELDFDGPGDIRIEDAAPFLANGLVRVQLTGRINEAFCLFIDATVEGTLP